MKKRFRLKTVAGASPVYIVQVRLFWFWVDVKPFYDPWDSDYAALCATELLDLLRE